MLNYDLIGRRIKEIRQLKKVSQADLAEFTDLSVSYISHIETGTKKASLESLVRIANVLGVTVDQLLNGNQYFDNREYKGELFEAIKDCSSSEKRIIYDVVLALKKSLRDSEWMREKTTPSPFYY